MPPPFLHPQTVIVKNNKTALLNIYMVLCVDLNKSHSSNCVNELPYAFNSFSKTSLWEIWASLRNGAGLLTPAGLWKERTHSSPGWRPRGQELERVHLLHRATNRPTLCQSWIKASRPSRLWLNFLSCFYLSGLWPTHSPHLLFTCLISSSLIFFHSLQPPTFWTPPWTHLSPRTIPLATSQPSYFLGLHPSKPAPW